MNAIPIDIWAVSPILLLGVGSFTLLTLDILSIRFQPLVTSLFFVFAAAVSSGVHLFSVPNIHVVTAFSDTVYQDTFSSLLSLLILMGLGFTLLLSEKTLEEQGVKESVDIKVVSLLATCGALAMIQAADLLVMFLGFELLSISVYALTGVARKEKASAEGALKYFILGAFSSAFLLYGIALIYGASSSLNFADIALVGANPSSMFVIGLALIIFGFAFKIALVPFHIWTPDVYQGAPTAITAFMAVIVKVAAVGTFLRILAVSFGELPEIWSQIVWILAVLSMTVGNLAALAQTSFKRMLAYSSIAHAGYMMIGFLAISHEGLEAVTFYLVVYAIMTVSSFGIAMMVSAGTERQFENDSYDSLRGLGFTHPVPALVLVVTLLSLAGMPPLGGFVGKFYLFQSAVLSGYTGLAIIAALNSVVSLYYYLRVIVYMYFGKEEDAVLPSSSMISHPLSLFAVSTCAILLVLLGVAGETVMQIVRDSVGSLTLHQNF